MAIAKWIKTIGVSFIGLTFWATAQAGVVTCGDSYRTASLASAESCEAQTIGSTAKKADIDAIFGGSWTKVGEVKAAGANDWLSITGWGSSTASGTWAIDPAFWLTYGSAVISIHVGGGQKDAVDNFEWLVTPETLSGTWSYSKLTGKGGGLSNIKLWGSGTPTVDV
ncbi:MAG: hypothetical protein EOO68_29695, partial [Moraxellaceae bacterium]